MADDPRTRPFTGQIKLNAEITAAIDAASKQAAERTTADLLQGMHDLIDPDTRAFWIVVNPTSQTINYYDFAPTLAGRWSLDSIALLPTPQANNTNAWPSGVRIAGIHGAEEILLNQTYPQPPIKEVFENSVTWRFTNYDAAVPAKLEIVLKRLWQERRLLGGK